MTFSTPVSNVSLPAGVSANSRAAALLAASSSRPLVLHTRVVSGTGGGPEKTILNSPRFLDPLGYDSLCVYFRPPGDPGFAAIEQRAEAAGAALIAVDDCGATDRRLLPRLRGVLDAVADRQVIWHGHDYKSNLAGVWLRRRFPMHVVSTVHGWGVKNWKTSVYYAIDRWCLRRCDAVVCVSTDLFDDCRRMGVPADRLTLIDNAIDLQQTRRTQSIEQAKRAIGWPASRLLVGAVGRLSPEKGFDVLINAVAQPIRDGVHVGLVIVGEGPARAGLEQQIASLGLGDQIRLAGFVAAPATHYQALDLYALSSLREGLPNVLLEAMAYEVPVVSTRVAGVPKLIDGHYNGVLVDCGSEPQLADAIGGLLSDPDRRTKLGQAARATVEQRFCFGKRMEKMAAIYGSALSQHP